MSYDHLVTSLDDGIFTITLHRPKVKNAISFKTMSEMTKALNEAATKDDVFFTIITGAGEYYSSGADLKSADVFADGALQKHMETGRNLVATIIDFPKLLIAIVNGPAVGLGVTMLGLCDLAFCTTTATFWTPFTSLGLVAEGCASYVFPRIMGPSRASNVLQFGHQLSAAEAKEYGLVSSVFEPKEIETILWPKLRSMKENLSKESVLLNKRLMRRWNSKMLHKVNDAEWKELESRVTSEDFFNSVSRFVSSRKKNHKL